MSGSNSDYDSDYAVPQLNTGVAHSARVWNYWLGGKDNFAADRQLGDQVREVFPEIVQVAQVSRAFLVRAVSFLAGQAGIRQFLDIGTGLPTENNTHEVAQRIAPESRIVYVDNDPLVLVHARALLTSSRQGVTDYVDAQVQDPDKILREAARTLDFTQPVGLMMLGILGNVADYDEAVSIVNRLMAALPSGSYLVVNDGTDSTEGVRVAERTAQEGGHPYHLRSPQQITAFFEGLELLEPGVVSTPLWRPEPSPSGPPVALAVMCGLARKP